MLAGHSGDIEKLLIDKSLVGKLSGETIADGKYNKIDIRYKSIYKIYFLIVDTRH